MSVKYLSVDEVFSKSQDFLHMVEDSQNIDKQYRPVTSYLDASLYPGATLGTWQYSDPLYFDVHWAMAGPGRKSEIDLLCIDCAPWKVVFLPLSFYVLGIIFFLELLMESTEPNSFKLNLAAWIVSSLFPALPTLIYPPSSSFHTYAHSHLWSSRLGW